MEICWFFGEFKWFDRNKFVKELSFSGEASEIR